MFHSQEEHLFDHVPGPSPWYLRPSEEPMPGCRWRETGETRRLWTTLLCDGKPVAAIGPYHYVLPLGERLLVWNQPEPGHSLVSFPVRLTLLEPRRLSPLAGDVSELVSPIDHFNAPVITQDEVGPALLLETTLVDEERAAIFPTPVDTIDELLILCKSSGIGGEQVGTRLALLVVHPRAASYRLYPQDWFNRGDYDFGYEWVTRVARNPRTGRVHGEGFRIKPFVLDNTLRSLAK